MTLKKQLQTKLHSQIPLTKHMQISINDYTSSNLITTAPLNLNINDKGTAFAGSLCTITTISAWSMCWLISQELGFSNTSIVILKNETKYLTPVTKDILCKTIKPCQKEIAVLKEKLLAKKSGSILIKSSIIQDNISCVEFDGIYVIKIL